MEYCLRQLAGEFAEHPLQFFHECEIHDEFYCLSRERLGSAITADGVRVHLLRHEYNTVWRYRRRNAASPFRERLPPGGDVGCIDFALLRRRFVEDHDYLSVMNKEEALRDPLREPAGSHCESPVIEAALEFKMAHCRSASSGGGQRGVRLSDFRQMCDSAVCDCRKLANEGPSVAYLVAFVHPIVGEWFDTECVKDLFQACRQEWRTCLAQQWPNHPDDLRMLAVVAGVGTFGWGSWTTEFPNAQILEA